jgi:hypothetical protein
MTLAPDRDDGRALIPVFGMTLAPDRDYFGMTLAPDRDYTRAAFGMTLAKASG